MTRYQMLYYTLLTKTIVDKAALVPAWEVPVALTWFIPREIKRGYIKEDELLVLGNHRAGKSYQQMKNLKYLSLTRKGYRHALDELKDVVPWVELMPEDFSGVQVPKIRNELLARYAQCVSAAAIMADLIGAQECVPFVNSQNRKHRETVAPIPADEPDPPAKEQEDFLVGDEMWSFEFEDDLTGLVGRDDAVEREEHDPREGLKNKTFNDLVRDAVQQYYSGRGQGSAAAPLRFIPANDIKNYFRELADNQSSALEDYSSGRYSGLIFNADLKKLCVVYNASSVCPLLGTQTYAEREQAAILAYVAANMIEACRCLEKKYAILHVASPNAFIKNYRAEPLRSKVSGKRTNNKSPILSAGYNRFWIVPQTHAGVREYHDILTKDIEVEQYELLSALRSGLLLKYYAEDRELAADFPLVDSDGTLVAVFPHLECTTLTRMETTVRSKKGKERSFRLLTRPWIVPYLERVFGNVPNIKIESMDDYLPENLTSQSVPSEPVYEMAVEKER